MVLVEGIKIQFFRVRKKVYYNKNVVFTLIKLFIMINY